MESCEKCEKVLALLTRIKEAIEQRPDLRILKNYPPPSEGQTTNMYQFMCRLVEEAEKIIKS